MNEITTAKKIFDPQDLVPILELPEGVLDLSAIRRFLGSGEKTYDPLWIYVKKVSKNIHLGQTSKIRFGKHFLGLRSSNRIPAYIDFKKEIVFLGRKLTIPFSSLRGILVAHGLMPRRKIPVFSIVLKVDGYNKYLPIHRCISDATIIDLADFLSSNLRVPLGIASRPLGLIIAPGSPRMIHSEGETPLYEMRGMLTARGPNERTVIKLLAGKNRIIIVDKADPLGWFEGWGIIVDDLVSIISRRLKSKYGQNL